MTRRERRKWERRGVVLSTLTDEERDKRMIDEITKKIADARAFQEKQIRRGIEPEPITVGTDWEPF